MNTGAIVVRRPGLMTTVQDLGRWGYQATGVAVAGPMDTYSHRLANLLVGNALDAATLEVTLIGPELEFETTALVAVCGADFDLVVDGHSAPMNQSIAVNRGARVAFGRRRRGARAYLAVAGGILVPPVLGSRATNLVSHMGGVDGRALQTSDRLPIAELSQSVPPRRASGLTLPSGGRAQIRLLPGPQHDWFDDAAATTLTSTGFRVSPRSNRMGYRLEGPRIQSVRQQEPISEPLAFGSLQIPPAGEPILLMADRQTTGGYPKIAVVAAADLPLVGQVAPGDFVDFVWCTRQAAAAALIARERPLLRLGEWSGTT